MAKYEHLLGQDPIGAFEKIKSDYVRYFKNAYHVENKAIDDMRMGEIVNNDNLYKDPYLEILPEYETYQGIDGLEDLAPEFADAFGSEANAREFFGRFIKAGLMSYKPYGHQVGMLRKAFAEGKNVVITSGTGSGKTESFLLPLFAQLFKEAKSWPQANYRADWYTQFGDRYNPCQRANEDNDRRPAAIRALVLYPMNALVADQMSRLRKALDSDNVRTYLHDSLGDNRIFFGSYNGKTIGAKSYQILSDAGGNRLSKEQKKVSTSLSDMASRFDNLCNYYNRLSNEEREEKEEVLYVNPRLNDVPTAEMLTRWDMQITPPDIMITNVSMLSISLMRKAEENIFRKTKEWLEGDPDRLHPTRIFHLVLDELHLYRGTSGSEVACLVRMLLDTIGLTPTIEVNNRVVPNPQLRILASSASLGSTERGENGEKSETEKYLEEFFGVYNSNGEDAFEVQKGSSYCPEVNQESTFDFSIFAEITPEFIELDDSTQLEQINEFARRHGSESIIDFTLENQEIIFAKIYDVIPKNNDQGRTPRAISLSNLAASLFGSVEALRGFLIYRAFVDKLNENGTIKQDGENALAHRLPRIRFHQFFKYVEGLWGELQPTIRCNADGNIEPATDADGNEIPPIKAVTFEAQEVGESGNKILELLRCENCRELFIGGNRRGGQNEAMSLNYPDLQRMPNFNPTPMVQNKSYKDYMIFWPTYLEPEQDLDERVAQMGTGKYAYADTNARGKWRHAYLHTKTGEIKTTINNAPDRDLYINGYLYYVQKNNNRQPINLEKLQALPCTCPHCAMDYARRVHVKSPIRSFRPGIDRCSQLLSKDLLYQLSEGSQKLIGFSDSREDAAKQAFGIEKEQYRDMVRMLFIDCVNIINHRVEMVIDIIEKDRAKGENVDARNYTRKFEKSLIPQARDIADDYLDGRDLTIYNKQYVDLSDFINNENDIDGLLVRKLVELGINPAGVNYKDQFTDEARNNHWNRAFDWNTFARLTNVNGDYCRSVYDNLTSAVFGNSFGKYMGVSVLDSGIGYICCKRSADKENSVEYRNLNTILSAHGLNVYDFVDAFIRILGDNYRYDNDEFDNPTAIGGYNSFGRYKKFVKAVAEHYHINENDLGNALYDYFSKKESHEVKLVFGALGFRLMDENAAFYECPKCHRVHPNLGMGVCTSCAEPLGDAVPGKTVRDLWKHYISHDILIEKKEPRRLHTEELTGQTDDIQTRLLEFKDLILLSQADEQYRKGEEKTRCIDMVNVTTTMEVGVDIGSLEAIYQGNMSPTRYNYQQRVGRGGRRGQAFSTAFTFCRGRSHDVHYYKNATEEIVGGLPAAPKLSLAPFKEGDNTYKLKLAIIKRVITKHILREAFKNTNAIGFIYDLHDTSGEFGMPFNWVDNSPIIETWIRNNPDRINEIIDLYTAQFNTTECNISNDINTLKEWAKCISQESNLIIDVTEIANHPTYADGFAQCLAEGGLLPMYGMPSDLRMFYHGFNNSTNELRSIDRSTEMAVTEFAPGSEKTKDKGKYRIEGITTSLRYQDDHNGGGDIVPMNRYDLDALYNCYKMTFDPDSMQDISSWRIQNIEKYNNDPLTSKVELAGHLQPEEKLLVIPMAYRSYKLFSNDGLGVDSNDKGGHFSQSTIFAKDNTRCTNSKNVGNVRMSAYGLNLNDEAEVWHINTNNNELFKGKYASWGDNIDGTSVCYKRQCPSCNSIEVDETRDGFVCNHCSRVIDRNDIIREFLSSNNFMFYKKYTTTGANAKEYLNLIPQGENFSFDIAIGSRKPTEMIKLEICTGNDYVDLNLTTGNESAIRAAFFSAAFLLQRTLADRLDVSPDEIEISEKIENDRPVIYLSDAAPNGAGIVSYLYQKNHLEEMIDDIIDFRTPFMRSLIDDTHRHKCKTACQDCLLTYSNRGYHHVLDWRLGVSILRLMKDSTFDIGFNPATRTQYQEFADYDEIVLECAQKLGQNWIPGLYHNEAQGMRETRHLIIYHPLWNKIRLIAMARADQVPTEGLRLYNIFRVLRSDLEKDDAPENIAQIPAMALNDQGQTVDPNTGITRNVIL